MATLKQHDDGSVGIFSEQEGKSLFRVGGPANPTSGGSQVNYRSFYTIKIPLTSGSALTAGMASWANPHADALIVAGARVDVTTGQSTTFTVSVGTATNSTAYAANLIDSAAMNQAGTYDNITDKGSAGKSRQNLAVGSFITVTAQTATPVTFVGNLYVDVLRV